VVDAIVLAGGGLERGRFQRLDPSIERKAQVPLLGRPMVEWAVRGLRSSPRVERVVVVGHPSLDTPALRELRATLVPEAGDIAPNLRLGLDALPGAARILTLSGDLPLVTRAAVDDLLEHAPEADAVFPYVERVDIQRDFPDRQWIFAATPDGHLTGSSAFLFRPEAVRAGWRWVEEFLNARRHSPLRLAARFGLGFAVKLALRRLRVRDVEEKLSELLHLSARGYRTRFSELAMDVDKYSDIAFVERLLEQRGR